MDIIKKARELGIPENEYAVCSGAVLQIWGLRETNDIDIITTEENFTKLRTLGFDEKILENGKIMLVKDEYDIGTDWTVGEYQPETKMLIDTADIVDGVRFVNLGEVMKWKLEMGREKDLKDVKLIKEYLRNKEINPI